MALGKDTVERLRERLPGDLLPASKGAGPLLQRDYWAVVRHSRLRASEVVELIAHRFPEFAPEELCVFHRVDGRHAPLVLGDELEVDIRGAGRFKVRVVHRGRQSLTLATLRGHPEAGRITFGAYPNGRGDVIFHIRSVARSGTPLMYLGFRTAGEAMQTNTWTEFVNRVAITVGDGVVGFVHADTRRLRGTDEPRDDESWNAPTYLARGDEP